MFPYELYIFYMLRIPKHVRHLWVTYNGFILIFPCFMKINIVYQTEVGSDDSHHKERVPLNLHIMWSMA